MRRLGFVKQWDRVAQKITKTGVWQTFRLGLIKIDNQSDRRRSGHGRLQQTDHARLDQAQQSVRRIGDQTAFGFSETRAVVGNKGCTA